MTLRTSWLVGALCVSFSVNLALAGFFLGKINRVQNPLPSIDPGIGILQALAHLPEKRREEVLARVNAHHKSSRREIRMLMRDVHQHRREVWNQIQNQHVDTQGVIDALDRYRHTLADAHDQTDQLMVELVSSMSAEERRAMLRRHRPHKPFGDGARRSRPRKGEKEAGEEEPRTAPEDVPPPP